MIYLKNSDYEKILDVFEKMSTDPDAPECTYCPSPEELDSFFIPYLEKDFDKLCYILWIDAEGERTPENTRNRKYLSKVIRENVKFVEEFPKNIVHKKTKKA